MASDMISRKALLQKFAKSTWYDGRTFNEEGYFVRAYDVHNMIDNAPAVDAIPIDIVAEILADLFGDEIPCNYNDIDEILSIGCEKAHCPDDGDHSCWKKYVRAWIERKGKDAQV